MPSSPDPNIFQQLIYSICGLEFIPFLLQTFYLSPSFYFLFFWSPLNSYSNLERLISRPATLPVIWDFCSLKAGLLPCFLYARQFSFWFSSLLFFSQVSTSSNFLRKEVPESSNIFILFYCPLDTLTPSFQPQNISEGLLGRLTPPALLIVSGLWLPALCLIHHMVASFF